jgi:hypothetical protein
MYAQWQVDHSVSSAGTVDEPSKSQRIIASDPSSVSVAPAAGSSQLAYPYLSRAIRENALARQSQLTALSQSRPTN